MIGHLRGKLVEKRANQVLVDVSGVGYLVFIPLSTFYSLGELHDEVTLLVHTHLREDALALYGFLTAREKHFFELLISASGVGPSLALKILSGMNVDELVPAIRHGRIEHLTRIPGVGKKTAERIVVELRDKMEALGVPGVAVETSRTGLDADVVSALLNLGYDRHVAEKAVEESQRSSANGGFEALLRASLQQLTRPNSRAARAASEL